MTIFLTENKELKLTLLTVHGTIFFLASQGSVLGPLLFNIFLSDLFIVLKDFDFASYPDDNTPYVAGGNLDEVIYSLEGRAASLFKWFSDNQMKANPEKCHLLLSTKDKK